MYEDSLPPGSPSPPQVDTDLSAIVVDENEDQRPLLSRQLPRLRIMARSGRWLNSAVTLYSGRLPDIRKHVPSFDRRPFAIASSGDAILRANEQLHTIVRLPIKGDNNDVPVGVVSKEYALLQHSSVFEETVKALELDCINSGSPKQSTSLFDISQILAWLAKERNDIHQQMEWRAQIPALMASLTPA